MDFGHGPLRKIRHSPIQRGAGFFSSLFKLVRPAAKIIGSAAKSFAKSDFAKSAGNEILKGAAQTGADLIRGENFEKSAAKNFEKTRQKIASDLDSRILGVKPKNISVKRKNVSKSVSKTSKKKKPNGNKNVSSILD